MTILLSLFLLCFIFQIVASAYECRGGKIAVQKEGKRPESNGCSKPNGIEVSGEEDFTYCCDRHDTCYSMCGASKEYCEKTFEKCMKNLCKTNFPKNRECPNAASTYVMGTTIFGGGGFEGLQQEYCTCIPEGERMTHYAKLVDNFYREFAPHDQKSTGEKLVNDAVAKKTPLWKLYYNLHDKYDKAIAHDARRMAMNPPVPPQKGKIEKKKTADDQAPNKLNREL
jgi:secretory phospholipase A2